MKIFCQMSIDPFSPYLFFFKIFCCSYYLRLFSFLFFLGMYVCMYLCMYVCIYWEGERECVQEEGREIGRERIPAGSMESMCTPCGAQTHKPWDHDPSQNQESDAQPTEPLRCPLIFLENAFHFNNTNLSQMEIIV